MKGHIATPLSWGGSSRLGLRFFYWLKPTRAGRVGSGKQTIRAREGKQDMTSDRRTGSKIISRRSFLKASAGTAALLGAVQTQFPFGANVAQAAGPEVTKAVLGYIALMDASPL